MTSSVVQIESWLPLPQLPQPRVWWRPAQAVAFPLPCFDSSAAVAVAPLAAAQVRGSRSPASPARLSRSLSTRAADLLSSIREPVRSAASGRSALHPPGGPSSGGRRDISAAAASRDLASLPGFCYRSAGPSRPEYSPRLPSSGCRLGLRVG